MIGRPDPDDRLARVEVVVDVLQLFGRKRQQAAEQDQQIALFQMFKSGNVVNDSLIFPANLLSRIDFVVLIQAEQHRAMKPMMTSQQPGQHRHRMFTAVFLIGRNQHNMLASPRTFLSRIGQPERTLGNRMLSMQRWQIAWNRDHAQDNRNQCRKTTVRKHVGISQVRFDTVIAMEFH